MEQCLFMAGEYIARTWRMFIFGAITEELHNALVSDPKPYRKDVKQLLANLLSMVEELQMDEIMIDKPNFSQRVRLR